jgi:mono/diheme cytochrome c family protein
MSDYSRISAILVLCLLTTACQQDMARQPSYRPLERSDFFPDGRASRPLVEGTVPWRGKQGGEDALTTYRRDPEYADAARAVALIGNPSLNGVTALLPFTLGAGPADYVDVCPIDIDKKALERGRDRFNIYCSVCHDTLGTGNGKIVERGYLKPPNYHLDDSRGFRRRGWSVPLRQAPIGYYFEVITRGYGGMPDYASQIPAEDRWKIIAWIRVLQRSQWVQLGDLPAERQETIKAHLRAVEETK